MESFRFNFQVAFEEVRTGSYRGLGIRFDQGGSVCVCASVKPAVSAVFIVMLVLLAVKSPVFLCQTADQGLGKGRTLHL